MQEFISIETLISNGITFIFILIVSFFGAFTKDCYNTLIKKEEEIKIARILVSTIVASIVGFALSDYIIKQFGYKITMLISFITGTIGFEAMGKISNLGFWIEVLKDKKEVINRLIEEEKKDG